MRSSLRFTLVVLLLGGSARAYDSGSTGADGALCVGDRVRSPDGLSCVPGSGDIAVVVALPPTGILNYTTVYVGPGTTLGFQRNAANTPVYLLATGDVEVRGIVDVSGSAGVCAYTTDYTPTGAADVLCWGGLGGPGGDDGGSIGPAGPSDGLGPGSGGHAGGALDDIGADVCAGGGGAGPTLQGQFGGCRDDGICAEPGEPLAASGWKYTHGGNGGGAAFMYWGAAPAGSGEVEAGGGGGGAIVIAAGGRIAIFGGVIRANGATRGYRGGGGGGGLVRLVAGEVTSRDGASLTTAYLYADSSCQYAPWSTAPFCTPFVDNLAACGAPGVIEIETLDQSNLLLAASPTAHFAAPRRALPWGESQAEGPRLTIVSVEDLSLPALPPTAHPHRHPLVTLPTGVALTVEVHAAWVPTTAQMFVGMNTLGHGRVAVAAAVEPGGTLASSVWQAELTVPAGTRIGDLQVWVPQIEVPE